MGRSALPLALWTSGAASRGPIPFSLVPGSRRPRTGWAPPSSAGRRPGAGPCPARRDRTRRRGGYGREPASSAGHDHASGHQRDGALLHTNLGRASLSAAAREAMITASGCTDIEYHLVQGERGPAGDAARCARCWRPAPEPKAPARFPSSSTSALACCLRSPCCRTSRTQARLWPMAPTW